MITYECEYKGDEMTAEITAGRLEISLTMAYQRPVVIYIGKYGNDEEAKQALARMFAGAVWRLKR